MSRLSKRPPKVAVFKPKEPGDDFTTPEGANPSSIREQGRLLYKKSQYHDAMQAFDTALALNPRSKTIMLEKVKCLVALGDTEQALEQSDMLMKSNKQKLAPLHDDGDDKMTYRLRFMFNKAEALFSQGDFEQALLLYHKGHKMRPLAEEFRLGVIKAEEALQTVFKKTEHEREQKRKQEQEEKRKKEDKARDLDFDFETPAGFELQKAEAPPLSEPNHVGPANFPMNASEKKARIRDARLEYAVMQRIKARKLRAAAEGRPRDHLQEDKDFLKGLFKNMAKDSVKNKNVKQMARAGVKYLDTRYQFWKQNLPHHLREKSRTFEQENDVERDDSPAVSALYTFLIKETIRINQMVAKGHLHRGIENCKKLIKHISEMTLEVPGRMNVMANCYSTMGNLYLDVNDEKAALACHLKDFQLGNEAGIEEARPRALDNLGRVYARIGDFRKAVTVWSEKLKSYPDGPASERTWLYHELGHCYLETDDVENARMCGEKALEAATEAKDQQAQLDATVLMAQALLQSGEAYLSRDTFMKALEYAAAVDDAESKTRITTALDELNSVIDEWKEKESIALSRAPSRMQSTVNVRREPSATTRKNEQSPQGQIDQESDQQSSGGGQARADGVLPSPGDSQPGKDDSKPGKDDSQPGEGDSPLNKSDGGGDSTKQRNAETSPAETSAAAHEQPSEAPEPANASKDVEEQSGKTSEPGTTSAPIRSSSNLSRKTKATRQDSKASLKSQSPATKPTSKHPPREDSRASLNSKVTNSDHDKRTKPVETPSKKPTDTPGKNRSIEIAKAYQNTSRRNSDVNKKSQRSSVASFK